jgi:hypothetical protein
MAMHEIALIETGFAGHALNLYSAPWPVAVDLNPDDAK